VVVTLGPTCTLSPPWKSHPLGETKDVTINAGCDILSTILKIWRNYEATIVCSNKEKRAKYSNSNVIYGIFSTKKPKKMTTRTKRYMAGLSLGLNKCACQTVTKKG
jgi:hypothetical protein